MQITFISQPLGIFEAKGVNPWIASSLPVKLFIKLFGVCSCEFVHLNIKRSNHLATIGKETEQPNAQAHLSVASLALASWGWDGCAESASFESTDSFFLCFLFSLLMPANLLLLFWLELSFFFFVSKKSAWPSSTTGSL